MNRRTKLQILVAVTAFAWLVSTIWAQQTSQSVPLDRTGVERTHVPHENANMWGAKAPTSSANPGGNGGGGGKPGGGGGSGIFTGTDYSSSGSVVNATLTAPAAEEHIAVDPSNRQNLVAAISDFSARGGWNTTKYVHSSNSGTSWSGNFVDNSSLSSGGALLTGDGYSWEANSDPVVAIDSSGNVYLADLYFNGSNNANGLYVSVSTLSGGVVFDKDHTYAVAVNPSASTGTSEDKEWIAVDNSNGAYKGRVYVSWTRFTSTDMIMFSSSDTQGVSWSAPKQISNPAHNGAVQGSQIAVGPNGEIYMTYMVYYVGNQRAHFLTKSTDGGAHFSTPVQISPLFGVLKFNSTYRKESFASLAVNPGSGAIYVVYADQPKNANSQVRFIASSNGGSTFTSPVSVNNSSSGQRLMPSVAADSTGIHINWFDTRNGAGSTALYDIYATRSSDGLAFSPNRRVTPTTINAGSASFIGDYGGIAALEGYAHPVWTSGGFNGGVLQTATLH